MKNLLINSAKLSKATITAHSRNSIELSNILGIKLVSTIEECKSLNRKDFETFIIVGAAFYPKTAEIEAWIRNGVVKRIVWINNEYQVSPNSEYARLIKDYYSVVISNVGKNKVNGFDKFHFLNLNTLLFDDTKRALLKKYDLIYYGTYRAGRRLYLQKYFNESSHYISSSSKNIRKFHQLCGINAVFCDKLSWDEGRETLNLFNYSLYVEDEFTHDNFNYLANRFYECLKCNVVQFFDESCRNTLALSGYEILEKYFVSSKEELEKKVKEFDFNDCLKEQLSAWYAPAIIEKREALECLSYHLTEN